jgi:hypothetical protein
MWGGTRQRLLRATLTISPAPAVKLAPPISSLPRLAVVSLTGTTIEYFAPMGATMVAPTVGPNSRMRLSGVASRHPWREHGEPTAGRDQRETTLDVDEDAIAVPQAITGEEGRHRAAVLKDKFVRVEERIGDELSGGHRLARV